LGYLGDLGAAISTQFSATAVVNGQQEQAGSAGSIGFDPSAERRYVEEGYIRVDPYQTNPKQLEILWQEPVATVLIKKRMFSSIADNYRPDLMDVDEKLFYKAMCLLFQNKCNQISALEQLSKIQQVTSAVGSISNQLVPVIISLADTANNGYADGSGIPTLFPGGTNPLTTQDATSFFAAVDRLRSLYAYNQTAPYTTWISDPTDLFQATLGPGSGVIEITNFTNLTASSSVDMSNPGSFSLTIVDPYESMLISDYDIEMALSDATNSFYNNKAFQFGLTSATQNITTQQNNLSAIRAARGASPITFNVDSNSIFNQPVTAIIQNTGLEIPFIYDGVGVTIPPDYLINGAIAGFNGIDTGINLDITNFSLVGSSELFTFQSAIIAIYAQLQLLQDSSTNFVAKNDQNNYARRKLRANFSGKLIIQPMDVAHIYINSKTQSDNKILSGLTQMFSGAGILQNPNNTNTSISNATDVLMNPALNIAIQAEKSLYVGPDFPNYLWALVRGQFVTENEGTHVATGLVQSADDNWDNGKFTISIQGGDNSSYFELGKINFNPGASNFNGLIYDSMTPFKSNFDSVTTNSVPNVIELLDENKYLMSETGPGSMVKFKLGAFAGEKCTQGNYIQDTLMDPNTNRITKTVYAPDGLVYKWKQGIGIFTQAASSANINNPILVGKQNLFKDPFQGLDVMNVISLLVTGTPYNYETFFQATGNLNGFQVDPQSNTSATATYLDSLRADLSKSNAMWGNFIPFKSLVMNQSAIAAAMQAQSTINAPNPNLDSNLKKFADLQSALAGLAAFSTLTDAPVGTPTSSAVTQLTNLQTQAANLQGTINSAINTIVNNTKNIFSQIKGASRLANNTLGGGQVDPTDTLTQQAMRRETNSMTRRMSYDVRANTDKNLFIVDDYYDNDYDLAAFNKVIQDGGMQQYSNDYTSVKDKIKNAANLLNLEVFADSQGHIRARPPQYNQMPSSIFYRMLYLKQTIGVQVFPSFMTQLFTDQLTTIKTNIEILEDEIRLICALLNQYPDTNPSQSGDAGASAYITRQNASGGMGGTFNFLSDSTDTITDINTLIQQANQEQQSNSVGQGLSDYDKIVNAGISTKQPFTNVAKYTALFAALQAQISKNGGTNVNNYPTTNIFESTLVQNLVTRIYAKSGSAIKSTDYMSQPDPNQPLQINTGATVDVFKAINDLSTYIGKWQQAVKSFYLTIKNAAEATSLDDDTTISNILSTPGIFGNTYIPELFEHMIEDESYDDYGPGSGSRYVIRNSQIKSLRIQENPPDSTMIEVHGSLNSSTDVGDGQSDLNMFPSQGNGLTTAVAIDYDMWRNYGFRQTSVIEVPFLHNPNTQLGPYAAMMLACNRSNILRGTCTIIGNEYMQPGEVVYLETRNLLFYIKSVRHNYALEETKGNFTTDLELTYGHPVGEYIPTIADTIGKMIIKNGDASGSNTKPNVIIQRQDTSAQEQNLGVVQLDGQNKTSDPLSIADGSEDTSPNDNFATTNQTVINNILYTAGAMVSANGQPNNNTIAGIELRIYYDNQNSVDSTLSSSAQDVMQAIISGSQAAGPMGSVATSTPAQNAGIPASAVQIVSVNLDNEQDRRSPSQKALDAARNQLANVSTNTGNLSPTASANNNDLRNTLFSYIIDCWLTLTPAPGDNSGGASTTTANSGGATNTSAGTNNGS
jgi:hypothetical protein